MSVNFKLLDKSAVDEAALKNARWLADQCRAENELVMPMAATVAQALADSVGLKVEAFGMTGGALGELIDHLAERYEKFGTYIPDSARLT